MLSRYFQISQAIQSTALWRLRQAPEEDQVGAAFERMILEAYRLMQEGRLDHAEMLVAEGAL